jgi:hypothetical protein
MIAFRHGHVWAPEIYYCFEITYKIRDPLEGLDLHVGKLLVYCTAVNTRGEL